VAGGARSGRAWRAPAEWRGACGTRGGGPRAGCPAAWRLQGAFRGATAVRERCTEQPGGGHGRAGWLRHVGRQARRGPAACAPAGCSNEAAAGGQKAATSLPRRPGPPRIVRSPQSGPLKGIQGRDPLIPSRNTKLPGSCPAISGGAGSWPVPPYVAPQLRPRALLASAVTPPCCPRVAIALHPLLSLKLRASLACVRLCEAAGQLRRANLSLPPPVRPAPAPA
jgi:hypothetical protein